MERARALAGIEKEKVLARGEYSGKDLDSIVDTQSRMFSARAHFNWVVGDRAVTGTCLQ